jgi:SPASM domain peptide maturase of grasp-with-spasm system
MLQTMNNKKYLKLFACCILVKGALRSIICDTQRDTYHFIPNELYDFLQLSESKDLEKLYKQFGNENKESIEEYVNFLIAKELAFLTDSPNLFPKIEETFHQPDEINNAILDFNIQSTYNYDKAIKELEILGCKAIQMRFFGSYSKKEFDKIINSLEDTSFNSVEILCSISEKFSKSFAQQLLETNRRISTIYLFNSIESSCIDINSDVLKRLILIPQQLVGATDCGCISPAYFATNLYHILEAKKHNTCLNKKVSIDTDGFIKNCPSMRDSYGSIDNTTISTIMKLRAFQKLWTINKDTIEVCKDCEFRYICSDCRAYTQSNNINSKPLKCNYDPYSATWN